MKCHLSNKFHITSSNVIFKVRYLLIIMEAEEESRKKAELSSSNTDTVGKDTNTVNQDPEVQTTSTESETTSTESTSKDKSDQSSENPPNHDASNTLKAEDKSVQDSNIINDKSKDNNEKEEQQSEDEDTDDDEEAVLESSPCGRWHKRKEQVCYLAKYS